MTIEIRSNIVTDKVQIPQQHELKLDWETYSRDMPQFWIAIFFIFLAVAELYQSIKDIDLPLPIYLGLGTILAIASNYQQQFLFDSGLGATAPVENRQINPLPPITADSVLSSIQTPLLAATQQQDVD